MEPLSGTQINVNPNVPFITDEPLEKEVLLLESEEMILGESYHSNFHPVNSDFDPEEFISSSSGSGNALSESDEDEGSNSESEEEDLDFDEDECSESESLFDDVFLKFRHMLDCKVNDTEKCFDRGVLRGMKYVNIGIQTEDQEPVAASNPITSNLSLSTHKERSTKCIETQTDDSSVSGFLSASREEPDCARVEIGKLRDAREPLTAERKGMVERLKAIKKATGIMNFARWGQEEKQLFELEEAIEAIDLAIEYKNEIICGHETILLDELAPGQERADLVTRLASLSVFDLQRLFCKFFMKVVELRFCTKALELNVDKLEKEREQMRRKISIDKKTLKEKDEEHEKRIKDLLRHCAKSSGGGGSTDILRITGITQELSQTKRKLLDFQHALTELLVRHGYLINGADFDVKHVVRMLGLDFGDLKQLESATRPSYHHHQSSASHSARRNINQRRNAEADLQSASSKRQHNQVPHPSTHGYGHGSSGGGSSHNHPSRQHQSRSSSARHTYVPFEGYQDRGNIERESKERDRHSHTKAHHHHQHDRHQQQVQVHEESPQHQHGTEVKRLKKKLIIQPNSSQ